MEINAEMQAIIDESNVQFPPWAFAIIISMTFYTVLYATMKSPSFKLIWPCGDLVGLYWVWYFTPVLFLTFPEFPGSHARSQSHRLRKTSWISTK